MVEIYPEFYNDVFGPIMQSGSSSHMAAPARAGMLCNALLDDEVVDILVELDSEGSFAGTFGTMNEDLGMLNGAMGYGLTYDGFFEIKEELRGKGISYKFDFCSMKESPHINSMKFILTGRSGKKVSLVANSTGGGMIETVWVNDYAYCGKGDSYVLFVFDPAKVIDGESLSAEVNALCPAYEEGCGRKQHGSGVMYWFRLEQAPSEALLAVLEGKDVGVMAPILPVPTTQNRKPQLFTTMTEWRAIAEKEGKSLADVAIDYEMAASGWTREKVVAYMRDTVLPAMHRCSHAFFEEDVEPMTNPFTHLYYKKWQAHMPEMKLNLGIISKSILYASSVMADAPNVFNVPGPMGAGGGFIHAILSTVQEDLGLGDEDVLRGLFVAAGVGAICYTRSAPTGEVTGCTGECGCCTAMAAAGVAEMLHAPAEQVENAASVALQAAVGWPCDNIPGSCYQPCMSRILYVSTMSLTAAEWAMSGQFNLLPFHEVLDVADKMGRNLDPDCLCTGRGGHCEAPSAQKVSAEFREWHAAQQ